MSSIDGPSDFTENMFDYMKGNKQPTAKKSSRVKSKVKPERKLHLKPDESGIIIESPSEFSDDTTNYTIGDKAMSSPAKSEKSELDGPSDFTANIVEYMRGNKAYSPSAGTSPQQSVSTNKGNSPKLENPIHTGKKIYGPPPFSSSERLAGNKVYKPPAVELDNSPVRGSEPTSQARVASSSPVIETVQKPSPKMNKNLVINGPSNFTATLAAFINGTTANAASVQTASKPTLTVRPMSSPAKGQNFDVDGRSDFTVPRADYLNGDKKQSGTARTSSLSRKDNKAPANNMNGTQKQTGMAATSSISKKDIESDIENSRAAVKTPSVNMRSTKAKSFLNHDDSEIEGPSDFTENLVEYMKGTKTYSPQSKMSSSATIAAASKSIEAMDKAPNDAQDDDLRKQIDELQAQLLQKDDTINDLRASLTVAEKKSADLESEVEQKNTTIDKLQISLKQSNQQCEGLEFELHQMTIEVDDLQENLNVSTNSGPDSKGRLADGHPKDVIVNTVQHKDRIINRLHDNNERQLGHIADLRAEIGDKDLLLIENVEEIRKPQSEIDCELLKDALSKYANDLNAQHEISDSLVAEKRKLEAIIASLQKSQAEQEEKQEKREEEWHARVERLMQEIDRRGAACMQLWGELENPGERDGKGRQKYTYKYTKRSTKGASIL